jgi:hypothetical protein
MTIKTGPSEPGLEQSAPDANVTTGQGGVALVNANASIISVVNHLPAAASQTYADFIADFDASAPAGRYDLFWSAEDKHRKRSLNGDIAPAEAQRIITRRVLEGDGIHVQECAHLLRSINRNCGRAILRVMDEAPTRMILLGMADGLGDFLADISEQSIPEAAFLLYLAATDPGCRDTARSLFTSDAAARLRQPGINELDPSHAAFILDLAGDPWLSDILNKMPVPQAALAIVGDSGDGRWFFLLNKQLLPVVLVEAARQDPDRLAIRLMQVPYTRKRELVSALSQEPDAFRSFTNKLSDWHLVIFMAAAGLTTEQVRSLLPRLRATVKVWPWLAAFRAIRAVAPNRKDIPHYRSTWHCIRTLAWIWWLVRTAAADWTDNLREQRERDVKMFIVGAGTILAVLFLSVIASTT